MQSTDNRNNNIEAFFALLRAGLWEQSVWLSDYGPIDFAAVYDIADAQSVVGLIAAGLEHVEDRTILKQEALPFMKKVFSLENRNASMNQFIGELVRKMQNSGIYSLLVKGQGVAQCYERPQWRSSGDIDFFLDEKDYEKAKDLLRPMSSSSEPEGLYSKHLGMTIDSWVVELHGSLRCGLSTCFDRVLDSVQEDTIDKGNVRLWQNGNMAISLPGQDNDVIFIFTHILKHFYKGGIGLRQICDWCRLLWTFRDSLNVGLLEKRVRDMRLMSEWKAFGAYAVKYLGMPVESMPLYSSDAKWVRKAGRIQNFILKVGNFGHNRDMSYYKRTSFLLRKTISFCRRFGDLFRHALIFPMDSLRFFPRILFHGLRAAARGLNEC